MARNSIFPAFYVRLLDRRTRREKSGDGVESDSLFRNSWLLLVAVFNRQWCMMEEQDHEKVDEYSPLNQNCNEACMVVVFSWEMRDSRRSGPHGLPR